MADIFLIVTGWKLDDQDRLSLTLEPTPGPFPPDPEEPRTTVTVNFPPEMVTVVRPS